MQVADTGLWGEIRPDLLQQLGGRAVGARVEKKIRS